MKNVDSRLYYQGVLHKKRSETALEYLDRLGLKNRWKYLPDEFSVRQKQRVSIARVLISQPQIFWYSKNGIKN
jgi:putative ABC transport system ATP-binding protein